MPQLHSSIVITACDAGYFELASELLESIQTSLPTRSFDVGILDLGLTPSQRAAFEAEGVLLVTPGWDIPGIRMSPDQGWYKAMTARPFLPRYFPQHSVLMWLDADLWIQRGEAILLFLQAAQTYGFAIVPELHRSYHIHYGGSGALSMHRQAYEKAFGLEGATQLIQLPILNSGAFAAHRDNVTWGLWADLCQQAMSRGPTKHSEQAALNAALYSQKGEPFHPLPAWCNWVCPLSNPLWNSETNCFVEPALPHESLGIIHLCHPEYHHPTEVRRLGGGSLTIGYRRKYVRTFLQQASQE